MCWCICVYLLQIILNDARAVVIVVAAAAAIRNCICEASRSLLSYTGSALLRPGMLQSILWQNVCLTYLAAVRTVILCDTFGCAAVEKYKRSLKMWI